MKEPVTLDRARVEHVAKLANLSLTPAETDQIAVELAAILKYVEELQTLDTSYVEPTYHVQLEHAPLREDVVAQSLTQDEALSGAPRRSDSGFAVPAFVES